MECPLAFIPLEQVATDNSVSGWRFFSRHDIDFARHEISRYSSAGDPFTVLVPCGMPRISDDFLESVFYLYPTVDAAREGKHMGGTGFLVGVLSKIDPSMGYTYAVTNRHVAIDQGHSIIRLNKRDGEVDIRELDPAEWLPHPSGDDLATTIMAGIGENTHSAKIIAETWFVNETVVTQENIGPGDDVFMVGRFIHHDGGERNEPAVRFGNLSIPAREILQGKERKNFPQLSFAVEMRSMAGYSGSPVFVFRGPWDMQTGNVTIGGLKIWLLGVNWGHITDDWEVHEKEKPIQYQTQPPVTQKVNYVRANTGMNGVIPAWKIGEMMDLPVLVEHRDRQEVVLADRRAAQRGGVALDSLKPEPPTKADNPQHREDFNRLLDAAVSGRKPSPEKS